MSGLTMGFLVTARSRKNILKPSGTGWKKKHHWNVESRWLIKTPGVVFALAMAVQAFTDQGDGVMIQQPVYYPFSEIIEDNDRVVVDNSLYLGEDGKYHMDLEDFERKAEEFHVKLFLLCSPHNPVGRVWSREELVKLGEICIRRDILVVSDEIHQDFVFEGEHLVFANLSEELKKTGLLPVPPQVRPLIWRVYRFPIYLLQIRS